MQQATLESMVAALEEQLEYSNVTELRQGLLPKIDEIQKKPATRIMIFKHGRPQGVLMSFDSYQALKKAANSILEYASRLTREQSIEGAIGRFEKEREVPVEESKAATHSGTKLAAS